MALYLTMTFIGWGAIITALLITIHAEAKERKSKQADLQVKILEQQMKINELKREVERLKK